MPDYKTKKATFKRLLSQPISTIIPWAFGNLFFLLEFSTVVVTLFTIRLFYTNVTHPIESYSTPTTRFLFGNDSLQVIWIITLGLMFLLSRFARKVCSGLISEIVNNNAKCLYLQSLFGNSQATLYLSQGRENDLFKKTRSNIKKITTAALIYPAGIQGHIAWLVLFIGTAFLVSPYHATLQMGLLIALGIVTTAGLSFFEKATKLALKKKTDLNHLFKNLNSSISTSISHGWMHAWMTRRKEFQKNSLTRETITSFSEQLISSTKTLFSGLWFGTITCIALAFPKNTMDDLTLWFATGSTILLAGFEFARLFSDRKNLITGYENAWELSNTLSLGESFSATTGELDFPKNYKQWTLDVVSADLSGQTFLKSFSLSIPKTSLYSFENLPLEFGVLFGFIATGTATSKEGEVRFDNLNLKRIRSREVAKNLAFIKPYGLLDFSFEELISDFSPVPDTVKIQESAKKAKVHAKIMNEPNHYQGTYFEEMDKTGELSFKLCLARAYYLGIETLVVFPPTQMNQEVQEDLFISNHQLEGKTALFINACPSICKICSERFVFGESTFTKNE